MTAILAASDDLAFGVREGLRQHRRDVPKDVSLIGFEHQIGHSRGSNLTSVCVDMVDVGRQLARLADSQIEIAQQTNTTRSTVPTRLRQAQYLPSTSKRGAHAALADLPFTNA